MVSGNGRLGHGGHHGVADAGSPGSVVQLARTSGEPTGCRSNRGNEASVRAPRNAQRSVLSIARPQEERRRCIKSCTGCGPPLFSWAQIGGMLGGFRPGIAGVVAGGVSMMSKTADVVLTLTDVRSTEQAALQQGHYKKTDLGWAGAAESTSVERAKFCCAPQLM